MSDFAKIVVFLFGLFVLSTITASFDNSSKSPQALEARNAENKHFIIGHGKALVSRQLKDPDSASFDGLTPHKNALCGYVNAKNSFGGYTGFSRFVSLVNRDVVMIEDSLNKSEFEMMWDVFCSAKDAI